jgi:5-methylcytosine-specific restriction endonuclease McrA
MMVCASPIKSGPLIGLPATGTRAGYNRHHRAGETACVACLAAKASAQKQWRADNPEYVTESNRLFRERNPDYATAWYQANKERAQAASRRWYDDNREQQAERGRRWRRENPDRRRAIDRASYERHRDARLRANREYYRADPQREVQKRLRRRARKAGVPFQRYTHDQLVQRLSMFPGCWMCGGQADTVDHVKPLAAGGPDLLSNLRPACRSCNASKGASWPYNGRKSG